MPSGVGTKYHVALGTLSNTGVLNSSFIGYLLRGRGYARSDSKIFAPRFGTGEQGYGDLDLYKTWAQDDFSGGSFQEYFEDTTKASQIISALRNPVDNLLYPLPSSSLSTAPANWNALYSTATGARYRASAIYKGTLYVPTNGSGSGAGTFGAGKGAIASYNAGTNTFTNVKADFATAVTGIATLGNLLWVATSGGLVWCYDGTTWTSDSRYGFTLLATFNGKLYANGSPGGSDQGKLWARDTGVGAAGVVTYVGEVGDSNVAFNQLLVYNHRLYIAKDDGLFAYDGVQISTIVDGSSMPNGIKDIAILNGSLYFLSSNRMYRFDGASIALVQDFGNYNVPSTLSSAYGRIYVQTQQYNSYGSDKNSLALNYINYNLYLYDGLGFTLVYTFNYSNSGTTTADGTGVYAVGTTIVFIKGSLIAGTYTATPRVWNATSESTATTTDVATITTSQYDGNFPSIDKMAAALKVYGEFLHASDTILAEMRFYDGLTWTGFVSIGTFTSAVNRIDLVKAMQGTSGSLSFKRVQIRFTYTRNSASTGAFKGFAFEYILSPVLRRDWTISMIAQGQADTPLVLADNSTEETIKAATLRDWIYRFRANVPPLLFQDIDTTTLTGAHNASVTTITVANTAAFGFEAGDLLTIDDEVIQIGAVTATTFTGCTRGLYGTTAASHSSGAIVIATYRVVLTKIQNESVVSPANVDGTMDTYGNESDITIQLSEAK